MKKNTKVLGTVFASIFTLSLAVSPVAQANEEVSNSSQQDLKTNNIPSDAQKEGDHYVKYIGDQELKTEMKKQGLDTSGFDSNTYNDGFTTEAAKKGGVTKAVYGKGKNSDKVNLYLSHGAATGVLKAGASGAAGALGALIGGVSGGFTGSFAGYFVNTFGGKAISKNGIIIKGNVDGTVYNVVSQ
ncbi:hypothetical protein [Staphylococcus xylosus]|uniref:hypothetical protein n=1 Tax=Staphylococcus xylosus TaxID=1288 RepID=UPI003F55886D